MSASLRSGVVRGQILSPTTSIVVESDEALDAASAVAAIGVRGRAGTVRLAENGCRAVWTAAEPLSPGRHVLTIDDVRTRSGEVRRGRDPVPFLVAATTADIPPEVRVMHMVRLRVHADSTERLPLFLEQDGDYVEVLKAYDRDTDEPRSLAFDQDGGEIEAAEVYEKILAYRREEYGRLEPALARLLAGPDVPERLSLSVWLRWLPAEEDRPARPVTRRDQETWLSDARRGFLESIRDDEITESREVPGAPIVDLEIPTSRVREISEIEGVQRVALRGTDGVGDLSNSIEVARSDHVIAQGFTGEDVRAALWDISPIGDELLDVEGYYLNPPPTPPDDEKDHALVAMGVIKNREEESSTTESDAPRPAGHAPNCALYSANARFDGALTWAVMDKECTVVCQVFHAVMLGLFPEGTISDLTTHDHYKDWLVVEPDAAAGQVSELDLDAERPLIVQSAGNTDDNQAEPAADEYVNHKGYNGLVVGNHSEGGTAIEENSAFRNPVSKHGDRQLPDIAANGTLVRTCGAWGTGTSFAAPAVAGAAAQLQEIDSNLKSWPEACRAILLAGTRPVGESPTWWDDVVGLSPEGPKDDVPTPIPEPQDRAQGAGRLDAYSSHTIAKTRTGPGEPTKTDGWDAGVVLEGELDNGIWEKEYELATPTGWRMLWLWNYDLKIVLAWDSEVAHQSVWGFDTYDSQLAWDLDLQVRDGDGEIVARSCSYDNSYEIVDFEGVPATLHRVQLRRWTGDGTPGRPFARYGIAWCYRRKARWKIIKVLWEVFRTLRDMARGVFARR